MPASTRKTLKLLNKVIIFLVLLSACFGCSASSRSDNEVPVPRSAETRIENKPAVTEPVTSLDSPESPKETVSSLVARGLQVIENQSFEVELNHWGKVKFISGKYLKDGVFKASFHLADEQGNIIYSFPEFNGNEWPSFEGIRAVSFKDLNQDGLKDVIIIAEYITGAGEQGTTPFPVASIYFQKAKSFEALSDLDEKINSAGKNETVEEVLNFTRGWKFE